ncbi:MAG TPA: hypothetical protein VK968_06015, partial [Roseimicrobium sp.]|nr:hypothetical protein [Roseimicrobium sp.]
PASLLRSELAIVMVVLPWTLLAKLRTILREAASLLRTKLAIVMVVLPWTLLAKLRTILREAPAALLRPELVITMAMFHARPLRSVLRELLSRLRPHRPVMMMFTRSSLWLLILRPQARLIPLRPGLSRLLRAIVLRLPLLASALKALRHLVTPLHLPGKTFAHLALEALPHLRLELLAMLHPRLRAAIATLRSLRRGTRSAGLRARTLRPHILPGVSARCLRSALIKWRPAISIATAVASIAPLTTSIAPITTRLIRTQVTAPRRAHLAIALATRLPRLIRARLRLRLSRLLRIAILRTALRAAIELREKFIRRDASIATAIELLQRLGRILHLLGIDHAIVIRIEQIK